MQLHSSTRIINRHFIRYIIGLALCVWMLSGLRYITHPGSKGRRIQHNFDRRFLTSLEDTDRQDAVRREFLHAWTGYKEHGWLSDSIGSITGKTHDQFCGWAATLIDSLDILYIMGLYQEFEEAVNATIAIDFEASTAWFQVNIFESTIRYLGGLLAAFDLSHDPRLLPKLTELGNILHSGFNSTNDMPCSHCLLGKQKEDHLIVPDSYVPLADTGSVYLEFSRLWQINGDEKYFDTVAFLTKVLKTFKTKLQFLDYGLKDLTHRPSMDLMHLSCQEAILTVWELCLIRHMNIW